MMDKSSETPTNMNTGIPAATAAMQAAFPNAAAAWLDIIAESGRFGTACLEQFLKTQQALLACRNAADVMEVQSDYFATAMRQYSEATSRFMEMVSTATGATMADVNISHARSFDDVPL